MEGTRCSDVLVEPDSLLWILIPRLVLCEKESTAPTFSHTVFCVVEHIFYWGNEQNYGRLPCPFPMPFYGSYDFPPKQVVIVQRVSGYQPLLTHGLHGQTCSMVLSNHIHSLASPLWFILPQK